jgi:DnaK suppressor protein
MTASPNSKPMSVDETAVGRPRDGRMHRSRCGGGRVYHRRVDHLTQAQVATLRGHLERERDRLGERLEHAEGEVRSADRPVERQDAAADEARRGTHAALAIRERDRLTAVNDALARMDRGEYGVCEETDEPIPYARLELEPTTRLGVEAMAARELEGVRGLDDRERGPY